MPDLFSFYASTKVCATLNLCCKPEQAQINYRNRWQIKTSLKAMKSCGFDIEKTHQQAIIELKS